MAKKSSPRRGSLQYWPRKRAKREHSKTRSWNIPEKYTKDVKFLGFAGYKVGMTHIMINDKRKNSLSKGMEISIPVTIIECPPLKIFSIRFYKKTTNGLKIVKEFINTNLTKENLKLLNKRLILKKAENKQKLDDTKLEDFDDIRVNVFTHPEKTGIGKKKPEIFELAIGGKKEDKLNFIKDNLKKEIDVEDVCGINELIDIKAVTTGKGFQGVVKRFGVSLKSHKSEKKRRSAGNLGAFTPKRVSFTVPQAGKMGYHIRTDYNKQIMIIGDDPSKINVDGGFVNYGVVKTKYLLVKGSIPGPKKRLIRMNLPMRPRSKHNEQIGVITYISTISQQRR